MPDPREKHRPKSLRTDRLVGGSGAPTRPVIDEVVGGRYRILEPLSTGGMGSVFLGRQLNLDRPVAIKLVTTSEPEMEARFEREARALATVAHPAIVDVYDYLKDDTGRRCFLVMAYVNGDNLEQYLKAQPERRLPLPEVLRLMIPVASALVELHHAGILHRDLKPSNIVRFLRADGRPGVKLVDFGIARRELDPELTADGVIIGTPAYLAPDVMLGRRHNPASDIWAFGATLYELLTGDTPFGKDDVHLIMKRTVRDPVVLPEELRDTPLGRLLLHLLAKEPEDRPDALAVLQALETLSPERADPDDSRRAPAAGPGGRRPARSSDGLMARLDRLPPRPRAGGRLVLVALVALLAGGLLTYLLFPHRPARSPAPSQSSATAPGPGPQAPAATPGRDAIAPAPDAAQGAHPTPDAAPPPRPDASSPRPTADAVAPAAARDAGPAPPQAAPPRLEGPVPSMAEILQACRAQKPPRGLLARVRAAQESGTTDAKVREHLRRTLHVLFQGGCAPDEIRLEAGARLARFYFAQRSCDAGRMVHRLYRQLHKRLRPGLPAPRLPRCPP